MLENDRTLLTAFRRGDNAALSRVYRHYAQAVASHLARGFALTPLELADAQQETFLRAFSSTARDAYDGVRPYQTYLLSIARAAAVDTLRSKGKIATQSVAIPDAPDALELPDGAPTAEAGLLDRELQRLVAEFLKGQPQSVRQLAQVRFMEARSQESAAEVLGLSRTQVRTFERRLRRGLLLHLKNSGWLMPAAAGGALAASGVLLFLFWIF